MPETSVTASTTEFPRHPLEGPELTQRAVFYPYGFPVEIRTNSGEVLQQHETMWTKFEQQHATEPITVDVQLVSPNADTAQDPTQNQCPPAPAYRLMLPF